MNSDHIMEQSETEHFTEDSSNIIPSSESDPPPPLTCHIPPCRSGDLCLFDSGTLNGETPGGTFDSSAGDMDTQLNERQRTFTQADDFQDMPKTCELAEPDSSSVGNSEEASGFSAYRLGVVQFCDTTKHTSPNLEVTQEALTSYPSPSDLPLMSQTDRIDLVWDNGSQFPSSQTRGSTPARLALMPDENKSSIVPTFASSNNSLTPRWTKSLNPRPLNNDSPFEEPFNGSTSQLHNRSIEGLSGYESTTTPLTDVPHSGASSMHQDSGSALPTLSSAEKSSNGCQADRSDSAPLTSVSDTSHATSDPASGLYQLFGHKISLHLSVISTPLRSQNSQVKVIYFDGLHLEFDETDPSKADNLFNTECTRLWSRMNAFFQGSLHSDGTESSLSRMHIPQSTGTRGKMRTSETVSSDSAITTTLTNTKPFLISNARTSSSSSDLFIPRTQRQRGKRLLEQVFPTRTLDARSSSSSSEHPPRHPWPPLPVSPSLVASSSLHPLTSSHSTPPIDSVVNPTGVATSSLPQSSIIASVVAEPQANENAEMQLSPICPVNNGQCDIVDERKVPDVDSTTPTESGREDQTVTAHAYHPSLTLVLETPSEDTEEQNSPCDSHKTIPDSASASAGACNSSSDETCVPKDDSQISVQPDQQSSEKRALLDTLPKEGKIAVYGRWHAGPYYYAGALELPQKGPRLLVHFDDGSNARLRPVDILHINLLPVQTEVYADWSNSGEFWADCVVEAHLMDTHRPYLVFCRTNSERKALSRREVSVHQSEVTALRESVELSSRLESLNDGGSLSKSKNEETSEQDISLPPSKSVVFSPEVSLANVLFSKRQLKTKRYRASWITPLTRFSSTPDETPDPPHSRIPLTVCHQTSPKTARARSEPARTMNGSLSSQSKRAHNISTQPRSDLRRIRKKQRLDDSLQNDSDAAPSDSEESAKPTPPSTIRSSLLSPDTRNIQTLPPDSSTSVFLRRSLGRSLGIPIPGPCVFSNWTIVFTGYSKVAYSGDVDRAALEQLVLACGGTVVHELSPMMLGETRQSPWSTWEEHGASAPSSRRYIAVVAPDFCRTLKYFQALATLGRVPILNTSWIVDACREEATYTANQNNKPLDCPMRLLLTKPGHYELPRGSLPNEQSPVSWLSVPVRYRSPAYRSLPSPSLFDLRADWLVYQTRCELVAIVTDDMDVFGPAWSNILQLASGAALSADEVPSDGCVAAVPVFSISEAPKALAKRIPKHHANQPAEPLSTLVLIDISELPADAMSQLDALPCQLVTCDYFIQSLICGYLLNPSDSSSFVPPRH
ncbi:unnamed protein product [Dicrocoelium dendriticum]|nr:unnamed protein product [Dicrocoelium dendriticum]